MNKHKKGFNELNKYKFSTTNLNAFLMLTFLYIFTYLFYAVIFEAGDDVYIQKIVQGAISGKPDEHLVFINVIIGYLLKPLYVLNNQIYWYSSFLLASQFISFFSILKYMFSKKNDNITYLGILIFFQYFIINLQFTSVSGLAAIAGFLILEKAIQKKNIQYYFLSFFFLSLSFLIRNQMLLFTSIFGVIFLILNNRQQLIGFIDKKFSVFLCGLVFVFLIFSYINENAYNKSEEWKYYRQFNAIRGKLNDNPNLYNYRILLNNTDDIYLENLRQIGKFYYSDKFDLKKMSVLSPKLKPSFKQYFNNLIDVTSHKINLSYMFLLVLFLVGVIKNKLSPFFIIPFLIFVILYMFISYNATVKSRIVFPIIMLLYILIVNKIDYKSSLVITSGVLILFFLLNNLHLSFRTKDSVEINLPKDKIIVSLDGDGFSTHPFKLNLGNSYSNMIFTGWLTNIPLSFENLKKRGFKLKQHLSPLECDVLQKKVIYYCDETRIDGLNILLKEDGKYLKKLDLNKNLYKIISIDTIQ